MSQEDKPIEAPLVEKINKKEDRSVLSVFFLIALFLSILFSGIVLGVYLQGQRIQTILSKQNLDFCIDPISKQIIGRETIITNQNLYRQNQTVG